MSDKKMIHLDEGAIKSELKDLVRNSVEETLNGLLVSASVIKCKKTSVKKCRYSSVRDVIWYTRICL